jgi:hypothetical protein
MVGLDPPGTHVGGIALSTDTQWHTVHENTLRWLQRVRKLDENKLGLLLPLFGAHDSVETMKCLLDMVPTLGDPARALELLKLPRDDCMRAIFRLKTVEAFLTSGDDMTAIVLSNWLLRELERVLFNTPTLFPWLTKWFARQCQRFDYPALDGSDPDEATPSDVDEARQGDADEASPGEPDASAPSASETSTEPRDDPAATSTTP